MFRLVRLGIKLVALLLVGYLVLTTVQVVAASRRDDARPADAIVVFGAAQYGGRPSPVLRARLDHAAALFERDLAPTVWVTGGSRAGDVSTEASSSARYLIETKDLPSKAVRLEVQGRSSWQQLAAVARILRREGTTRVLLVSDPFHSARIDEMARELGLDAHVSPTRTSPITGAREVQHLGRETAAIAVGRIIGFRRLVGVEQRARSVRNVPTSG